MIFSYIIRNFLIKIKKEQSKCFHFSKKITDVVDLWLQPIYRQWLAIQIKIFTISEEFQSKVKSGEQLVGWRIIIWFLRWWGLWFWWVLCYDSDDDDDRINKYKYKDSILYQESELHSNIFLRRRCNRVHSRIANFIKSYEKNNTISGYCVLALLRSIKKEVRYFKWSIDDPYPSEEFDPLYFLKPWD